MAKSTDKTTSRKKNVPQSKTELKILMKMEMLKYCLVWGYNENQTIAYFAERGVNLSHTNYYDLKREFNSDEATKGWYTEQAISAMEVTHKQSVEQLDELIKTTMAEIQQLQATPVYTQTVRKGQKEPQLSFNPNHDTLGLAKMMDTLTKLISTRDDMLAATPVVQAIMNKHNENQTKAMTTR